MAARRLLIVLIVLLVLSTLAAALAPSVEEAREDDPPAAERGPEGGEPEAAERPARPGLLRVRFELPPPDAEPGEPARATARVGERVALEVRSERGVQIELPTLGMIDWAGRGSPARFELLAREPAEIRVRARGRGEIGRIAVEAADPRDSPAGNDATDQRDAPAEGEPAQG
jgi:hypothetical protein